MEEKDVIEAETVSETSTDGKKQCFSAWDTVIAFLSLEALALISFGLGGSFGIKIFDILGFFIGILSFGYAKNYLMPDLKYNLKWLVPLGLFFVLLGFSAFYFKYYGGLEGGVVNSLTSILYLLLETLGLVGFFLLGLGMRYHGQIKKEYILYALLGGLALYCVLVGFYNLIRYGFFYAGIYRGLVYYYQGVLYRVDQEAKAFLGFTFKETSLSYACLPAFVLACSGVGLFKLNPKTDEKKFYILLLLAAIGLLFLLLIPAWQMLIVLLVVYAFFGLYFLVRHFGDKDEKKKAIFNKVSLVLYALLIAGVAFLVFALLTENRLGIISKLLTGVIGRVPASIQTALKAVQDCIYNGAVNADLHKVNLVSLLFGFNPSGSSISIHPTRFFEINILWQNGLLAFLLLCFLILLFVKKERDYLRNASQAEYPFRLSVVAMLLGIVVYMSFFADDLPLIHGNEFLPFTHGHIMLIAAFLLGVSYEIETKKEVAHE